MNIIWYLKELNKYIFRYKMLVIFVLSGQIFEAAFDSGMKISLKFIIDAAVVPQNYRLLLLMLLLLGGGAIVFSVAGLLGDFFAARFSILVINDIRRVMFERLQGLSIEFFRRRLAGDIVNCFVADIEKVESSLLVGIPITVFCLFHLLFSVSFLFFLNWQLAIMSCIGLTFCLAAPSKIARIATNEGYHLRQKEGIIASLVEENIISQSVVKIFGLERRMLNTFSGQLDNLKQTYIKAKFLSYLVQRFPYVAFVLLQLAIFGVSAMLAYRNWITVGTLVSYVFLLSGLNFIIINLTFALPYLISAVAGMQRLNDILAEVPQVQDASDAVALPTFSHKISFEDVTFNYSQNRGGINNLSLNIYKGNFIVFVGLSGAGKSTIVNLLTRFYDPQEGRILFDGVDLRSCTQHSLRSQIGLVSQDIILFNCSVRENIRMGYLEASDEQVEAAAKAAEIHDFILTLPQGYDTSVGERGGWVSGGQRQRIALARALVRNPAILILDEATSALDPITEAGIFATLSRIATERTLIVITHRISQALRADLIFVLDSGRIVAAGSHTDLIQQGGLYATLWHEARQKNGLWDSPAEKFAHASPSTEN